MTAADLVRGMCADLMDGLLAWVGLAYSCSTGEMDTVFVGFAVAN